MDVLFYLAAVVGVIATALVITRSNAIHALLYFVVSLFSTALVFYAIGAPFVAALEVILYAGAILVLFVFVVMLLNVKPEDARAERRLMNPRIWVGPVVLAGILAVELVATGAVGPSAGPATQISPQAVGETLMGPYLIGVELSSILLLAGLLGAKHLGRRIEGRDEREEGR